MIGDAWMSEHLTKYIGKINHNSSIIQIPKKDNSSVITFYNFLNMRIMGNGMSVKGIVILTIEENYNLVEQTKVFETVCKYMGLMDNNSPKEEIHHREDASWYYDQAEIPWLKFHDMLDAMEILGIKITRKLEKK